MLHKTLLCYGLTVLLLSSAMTKTDTASGAEKITGDAQSSADSQDDSVHRFRLDYRFTITGLKAGKRVRVWVPAAQNNSAQRVKRLPGRWPTEPTVHTENTYGNRILFFETKTPQDETIDGHIPYKVVRKEVTASQPAELTQQERQLFLSPNRLVPTRGKPVDLLNMVSSLPKDPTERARRIYDLVFNHVDYRKEGTGWGRGDVRWVCDSGYGNCTDFHSLFIALCRSQGIPARFTIGFPISADKRKGSVGGYHCWAHFYLDSQGWIPVDISEADKQPAMKDDYFGHLPANRVAFTTGRDIDLLPQQNGPPPNYFVTPYVEVDGKRLPEKQIRLKVSFSTSTAAG